MESKQLVPLLQDEAVIDIIPQKPPMSMLDTVYEVTENTATVGLTVQADNIFCDDGYFQAIGLTEHMAQSAAAHRGYLAQQNNEATPVGFIATIRNLKIHELPKIGDHITTQMEIISVVMNFHSIQTEIRRGDDLLASCEMKLFLREDM
ncbi:MAG: hypothetical protein MK212_14420 [Saprospiraceae bacterium]|nr:hypothetical protein [Saprospiraceae bacterium]